MDKYLDRPRPVLIAALIESLLLAGSVFGLNLTPEQIALVMTPITIAIALFVQSQVTPVSSPQDELGQELVGRPTRRNCVG